MSPEQGEAATERAVVTVEGLKLGAEFNTPNGRVTVQGVKRGLVRVVGPDGKAGPALSIPSSGCLRLSVRCHSRKALSE